MLTNPQRLALTASGALLLSLGACRSARVEVTHPAIRVDDTVRLAADVILPIERPAVGVPTILIQTRYWRSFRMRGGGGPKIPQGPRESIAARLVQAGYAVVITDVRGTGASDGVWRWPWSADEVRDMGPTIDWIVAQPWSNHVVGATGVSYEGTTALLAAASGRPALNAVLARQIEWQLADETLAPGGVRNALFADTWGDAVNDLDHGRYPAMFPTIGKLLITGVGRRDDDPRGITQRKRQDARPSSDIAQRARGVTRGSDLFGVDAPATDSLGPAGHVAALANTRTIVGIWGSWWDGATADAVFRAQDVMPISEARIGPWNHEGDQHASPLKHATAERGTVDLDSVVAFFDRHLRAKPSLPDSSLRLHWYVAGAERWRSASQWPRTTMRAWSLVTVGAMSGAPAGEDSLQRWRTTDRATTGRNNRWTTGLARPVDIVERGNARGIRSFQLPALTDSLTVFGAGAFTCRMAADQPAATLHVYVESIDPAGHVRLLTEGMQTITRTAAHAASAGAPGSLSDTRAMEDVSVRIRPVAFTLFTGWRIRVSLANEDAPTFERVPQTGPVGWTIDTRSCALTLPVETNGN
jgi:putative CocE/NonD family hydrolase